MSLGTKINLTLVLVTSIVLTAAFWVIVGIEAATIKDQVLSDSKVITDIMRSDIERMFGQVYGEQDRLQAGVDKLSKIEGVKRINVASISGVYIATTDQTLVGKKITQEDASFVEQIRLDGKTIDTKNDAGTFYLLNRRMPVRLSDGGDTLSIVDVVEIEVKTASKSAVDILGAQKLLHAISVSIEQNARSVALLHNEDFKIIQNFTDELMRFGFYKNLIVFDDKLSIVAITGGKKSEPSNDTEEYKQLREDVITGKKQEVSIEHAVEGENNVIVRMTPIRFLVNGKTERAGIVEAHILTSAYIDKINSLQLRMIVIGIIFTIVLVIVIGIILRIEVVEPITRYSKIAKKVSDGDLNQVIEHTTDDEIGHFGDVFNSMVVNLRELDRMKSDFLSVAAHQLRTPLSGVKWVLKLVLDGDLGVVSEAQKGMLTRGYETNEKMIQLVNDLLNVSRIENGKFGYDLQKNDFTVLLKTLVENSKLVSSQRQIEVRLENKAGNIPPFFFDFEKLLIAFQNLVDNAVKYTLPGGHVTIGVEYQGDYLQVKVSDTGVGVPKAELPKLFSKFFRASNVIHLQTDGSGLGLFIVKNIILRHGGQIWIDSVEGKGTSITVVIPIVMNLPEKKELLEAPLGDTGTV